MTTLLWVIVVLAGWLLLSCLCGILWGQIMRRGYKRP